MPSQLTDEYLLHNQGMENGYWFFSQFLVYFEKNSRTLRLACGVRRRMKG